MDNRVIAARLREHARELDRQRGNLLRVRAYRLAAHSILEQDLPLDNVFEQGGRRALKSLPNIGSHIAKAIESIILDGDLPPTRPSKHPKLARQSG